MKNTQIVDITSSDVDFCSTNSRRVEDRTKKSIIIVLQNLKSENLSCFCFMDSNNYMISKIAAEF